MRNGLRFSNGYARIRPSCRRHRRERGGARAGPAGAARRLAEQRGMPEEAREICQRGEDTASTQSPVHTARLLLAHGRLLRRTGNGKDAVERLRRARAVFSVLRAAPFIARTEQELAECHLPGGQAKKKQSVLALTSRETEVAHLVGKGLSPRSRPSCSSAARPWSITSATSTPNAACNDASSCGASSSNGVGPRRSNQVSLLSSPEKNC
jgi:hypothetical protein